MNRLCIVVGVVVLGVVSSLAWGQGEEPEMDAAAIAKTPVGKQLTWVLSSINGRVATGAEGRFTPRFLEQYTLEQVRELLVTLRDRAFKGAEVSLIEHEANPRPDALSCVVGNDDSERYLSLLLAVNEETGKIAGMTFTASLSARDAADGGWNDLAGDMGRLQTGVWFGAYGINFEAPGTDGADVRIRGVYEFGGRKRLNIATASRVYLLNIAAAKVADGTFAATTPIGPSGPALAGVIAEVAKGDLAVCDQLSVHLTREVIEEAFSQLQEDPQATLPYLTFAEWTRIKSPDHAVVLANYLADEGALRRSMLADRGEVGQLVAAVNFKAPTEWKVPVEIQRIGWFATNKEAGYAMARLALLEQHPKVIASGLAAAWRQRQSPPVAIPAPVVEGGPAPVVPRLALELDPKVWVDSMVIRGSEPGCQSLFVLLKRQDGQWYTQVMTWNNVEGPLDEPRLFEMAQKGVEILAGDEPPKEELPKDERAPAMDP